MTVKTYNVSSAASVVQSKLAFDVWDEQAEEDNGVMRIFAKIKVPADLAAKGVVNQVWQVGPSVDSKGIHGVLNAVSWGVLFPIGIIIARYLRPFQSADPAWFYLHVSCQVSAYAIGVAGWGTGLKLGSESKGIQWTAHRNIGISLFSLATLQIFALFLRPKKDHKYRFYWNIYHHGVGYAILVLGIVNVFKGLDILHPEEVEIDLHNCDCSLGWDCFVDGNNYLDSSLEKVSEIHQAL
ncbi:hypothetical protein GH714_025270 [Hevea brasiliensis]|uniref:Cytochrome b561 domain-containing protein n=1 Tax=Hevea brasiliensis TaxID=3981 RepID=A0A6A6KWW9_HEVBR|nr:hypothetical protein GH714_025270 [Hevea brasiliensis]